MRRSLQAIAVTSATLTAIYAGWLLSEADGPPPLELARLGPAPDPRPHAPAVRQASSGEQVAAVPGPDAPAGPTAVALKLEVARIDTEGVSVLAGRAPAGHSVSILANGREVANTVSSADGQWSVIASEGFAAGPLELSLVARPAGRGPETRSAALHLVLPPTSGSGKRQATAPIARAKPAEVRPQAIASQPAAVVAEGSAQAIARFEAVVEKARVAGTATPDANAAPVPVPITFVTGDAAMTPIGVKAATMLAEYLRLTRPEAIVLSGHADSRGADGFNLDLSRRRLETIERYLRREGYGGRLALLPKGEHEPYQGIDRRRTRRDDVWQADRRVELRITQ